MQGTFSEWDIFENKRLGIWKYRSRHRKKQIGQGRKTTAESSSGGQLRRRLELFVRWFQRLRRSMGSRTIVGMEPTGHYWLNLAYYLGEQQVLGNSMSLNNLSEALQN